MNNKLGKIFSILKNITGKYYVEYKGFPENKQEEVNNTKKNGQSGKKKS